MTSRHARPAADSPRPATECKVATQALCSGPLETAVFGVPAAAARPGNRAHIGIKFGRILIYLEDRDALDSLRTVVEQASAKADEAFGPVEDLFTTVEARSRRRYEQTGDVRRL